MRGKLTVECNPINQLISRLAAAGELLTDPPGDPAERDRQIARVVARFPFVVQAPDWLAFLHDYGGLTYVRDGFSTGFFGVSHNASVHILDGEGDPIADGCLLICDADPPVLVGCAAFGFDATGERRWGVYGVSEGGDTHWFAPTFTEWLESFADAIT